LIGFGHYFMTISRILKAQKVFCVVLAAVLGLGLGSGQLWAQTQVQEAKPAGTQVTAPVAASDLQPNTESLEVKLKELETNTLLEPVTKETMARHYRQALTEIKSLAAFETAAKGFATLRKEAPDQIEVLRKALDMRAPRVTLRQLGLTGSSELANFERVLSSEQQHKVSLEALLAETDDQLQQLSQRGPLVKQRLDEVRKQSQDLEAEMAGLGMGASSQLAEAKGVALRARLRALQGESQSIDQELRSLPLRQELLRLQREQNLMALELSNELVARLRNETDQRRMGEANKASAEADVVQKALGERHALLGRLAEENSLLAGDISEKVRQFEATNQHIEEAKAQLRKYRDDFQSAKQKLEVTGLNGAHGRLLLEQRRNLPNTRQMERRLGQRERQGADLLLEQLTNSEQRKELADLAKAAGVVLEQVPVAERAQLRPEVMRLLEARRELLDRAKSQINSYLQALVEQDFSDRQLIDQIKLYENLLSENLLWIPSNEPFGFKLLAEVPEVLGYLFSEHQWRLLWDGLTTPGRNSLGALVLALGWATLLWIRPRLRKHLTRINAKVSNPLTDKLSYSFQALGVVLIRACAWPLLLLAIWMQLDSQVQDKGFGVDFGRALFMVSPLLLQLGFIWRLCDVDGVMRKHFHWHSAQITLLRHQAWLMAVLLLPASMLVILSRGAPSNAVGLLAMMLAMLAITYFLANTLHPVKGLPAHVLLAKPHSLLARTGMLWYGLILALPLLMLGLAIFGYYYTVGVLGEGMVYSLLLAFALVLARELLLRWLLIRLRAARRAIWEKEWKERQEKAGSKDKEDEGGELQDLRSSLEDPGLDLSSVDAQTRRLLGLSMQLGVLLGLWWIWTPILPAFGSFGYVELWSYSIGTGDSARQLPVTLGGLILALFIGVMTLTLVRNLPSLLEIMLFKQLTLDSGTRYAYSALIRYLVIGIGLISIFSILGGSWSEIRWLVAALSVGIGFGLQEIVANFISGIIILFERPIRVGDVVTVGNVSGVVSRIRIRATTITNWDRQELLVPNKEFITKQLLNWSLSDPVTRISIPVGVDYDCNLDLAMRLMNEAAREHDNVMSDPSPSIVFDGFGDNTLNLILRCFLPNLDRRGGTISDLNMAIHRKFMAAGISVAFPQRDVHLDSRHPLEIRIVRESRPGSSAAGNSAAKAPSSEALVCPGEEKNL
jgi:potassium efflux system protein